MAFVHVVSRDLFVFDELDYGLLILLLAIFDPDKVASVNPRSALHDERTNCGATLTLREPRICCES